MKKFVYLLIILISSLGLSLCQDITINQDSENTTENFSENDNSDNQLYNLDEENSETSEINNEAKDENINETPELKPIGKDNGLGLIGFAFCNEGTDNLTDILSYAVNPGTPLKVCVLFYNNANEDIKINVRIVDKLVDSEGGKYCAYDSTNIHNFIDKDELDNISEIVLPSGEYVIKEFAITYPIGIEGNQSACFSYYIEDPNEDPNVMIKKIVSKGYTMNFFVGGVDDLKNEIKFNDVSVNLNENKQLKLDFNISNIGNLENKIEINGTISNIFGFKSNFTIEGKGIQLKPGSTIPVSTVIGSLPNYGGLFNIEFTATATPFFSYDISNSSIDPSLLESKEFTESTTFFQMPWLIIIIAIMFIIILISIFRKPKKEVVYVQAPQGPMPNNGYQQPQYQAPQQNQYQQPYQNNNPQN